jgi:ribonuclease HI
VEDTQVPVVTIYVDGVCQSTSGCGGWAAILFREDGGELELSGSLEDTSLSKIKLFAVIKALEHLDGFCIVDLFCSSRWVMDIMHNSKIYYYPTWVDMVDELYQLKRKYKIHCRWIRMGSDPVIAKVYQMARMAILKG